MNIISYCIILFLLVLGNYTISISQNQFSYIESKNFIKNFVEFRDQILFSNDEIAIYKLSISNKVKINADYTVDSCIDLETALNCVNSLEGTEKIYLREYINACIKEVTTYNSESISNYPTLLFENEFCIIQNQKKTIDKVVSSIRKIITGQGEYSFESDYELSTISKSEELQSFQSCLKYIDNHKKILFIVDTIDVNDYIKKIYLKNYLKRLKQYQMKIMPEYYNLFTLKVTDDIELMNPYFQKLRYESLVDTKIKKELIEYMKNIDSMIASLKSPFTNSSFGIYSNVVSPDDIILPLSCQISSKSLNCSPIKFSQVSAWWRYKHSLPNDIDTSSLFLKNLKQICKDKPLSVLRQKKYFSDKNVKLASILPVNFIRNNNLVTRRIYTNGLLIKNEASGRQSKKPLGTEAGVVIEVLDSNKFYDPIFQLYEGNAENNTESHQFNFVRITDTTPFVVNTNGLTDVINISQNLINEIILLELANGDHRFREYSFNELQRLQTDTLQYLVNRFLNNIMPKISYLYSHEIAHRLVVSGTGIYLEKKCDCYATTIINDIWGNSKIEHEIIDFLNELWVISYQRIASKNQVVFNKSNEMVERYSEIKNYFSTMSYKSCRKKFGD